MFCECCLKLLSKRAYGRLAYRQVQLHLNQADVKVYQFFIMCYARIFGVAHKVFGKGFRFVQSRLVVLNLVVNRNLSVSVIAS